jgi:hypothetical protein
MAAKRARLSLGGPGPMNRFGTVVQRVNSRIGGIYTVMSKTILPCSFSGLVSFVVHLIVMVACPLASVAAEQSTLPSASGSGTGSFSLNATNLMVNQGSSGSSTITVTPIDGYRGTVELTFETSDQSALQNLCYSFSNMNGSGDGTVTITGPEAVTTQLTLDTNVWDCVADNPARAGSRPLHTLHPVTSSSKSSPADRGPLVVACAGILFVGFLARKRARVWIAAFVIALSTSCLAVSGCGASNSPTGTYTVTVTGQDSIYASIPIATTTFTFTIQ